MSGLKGMFIKIIVGTTNNAFHKDSQLILPATAYDCSHDPSNPGLDHFLMFADLIGFQKDNI